MTKKIVSAGSVSAVVGGEGSMGGGGYGNNSNQGSYNQGGYN